MSPSTRAKPPLPDPVKGRIAVVGPCASGKTVLVERLCEHGYDARQCAQEHSYLADMWQRLSRPEVLIYLDVSLEASTCRRRITYGQDYIEEQRRRLAHARQHANVYVDTDGLSEESVFAQVVAALTALGVEPASEHTPETEAGVPGTQIEE